MKRRAADLEARLVEWGREYGGGKYELQEGLQSPMGSMMKWGGRPPSGLGQNPPTPGADEVQAAVHALAQQISGWPAANVLRVEYFHLGRPVQAKIQSLHAMGIMVSDRARYSQLLRDARIHVAAWLRMPLGQLREEDVSTS